jgi:hypothetical protein
MKKILIITLIIFSMINIKAQDSKFQAMSVYNFTRTLQWPEDYQKGNFVINFIGDTDLYKELEIFCENKKVRGEQKIILQKNSIETMGKCQIVIISKSRSEKLTEVINSLSGKSTLIITEEANLTTKGAGISFTKEEGIVKYQFNTENIKKYNIAVSTSFKQIGIEN